MPSSSHAVVDLTGPEDLPQSLYDRIRPPDFFEVRIHNRSAAAGDVGLLGLCANYEAGRWRAIEFADLLFDYLPEFALEYSELAQFNAGTGRRQLRKAALLMYASDKYKSRGEFGELLLHAACREIYRSEPAISKIFFKGAVNETVHGFDSVHSANGCIPSSMTHWLTGMHFSILAGRAQRFGRAAPTEGSESRLGPRVRHAGYISPLVQPAPTFGAGVTTRSMAL